MGIINDFKTFDSVFQVSCNKDALFFIIGGKKEIAPLSNLFLIGSNWTIQYATTC